MERNIEDPVELIIAKALGLKDIKFVHESENPGQRIDFYIPAQNVFIECKQFHTERTLKQLEQHDNIILIQGRYAAQAFSSFLLTQTS